LRLDDTGHNRKTVTKCDIAAGTFNRFITASQTPVLPLRRNEFTWLDGKGEESDGIFMQKKREPKLPYA
jgi:hypothetical protein